MTYSTLLLAAAAANVPRTLAWSPKVAIVMILANILAIAIARLTVKNPNVGPQLPASGILGNLSIAALIGATCFGHILGTGAILGLAYLGGI